MLQRGLGSNPGCMLFTYPLFLCLTPSQPGLPVRKSELFLPTPTRLQEPGSHTLSLHAAGIQLIAQRNTRILLKILYHIPLGRKLFLLAERETL